MNIVLGVTGGIAAYKSVLLARLLVEAGHEVHVVPTADALRFVGTPTWEAISRHPVTTSVHDDVPEVRHVALGQRADLVIVAPATANTIARMTAGLADDLLGTTLLATRAPVLVAPAMHTEMWQHAATQDNIAILRSRGVAFVGPDSGRLTGDDSGPGRMSEPEAVFDAAMRLLSGVSGGDADAGADAAADAEAVSVADAGASGAIDAAEAAATAAHADLDVASAGEIDEQPAGDLQGMRLLVTAGGTREPIDPVRYLGNRSSGRQGVAIAAAAADRGAKVVLLAANIEAAVLADVQDRPGVRVVPIGSAAELEAAATAAAAGADTVVMAAAVADYRVANVADRKLRKEDTPGQAPRLELVENPDILAGLVQRRRPDQVIVGFAAETVEAPGEADDAVTAQQAARDELLERGRRKIARKGADLLAVNAVGWQQGFESAENALLIIDANGDVVAEANGTKRETAERLLDAVAGITLD